MSFVGSNDDIDKYSFHLEHILFQWKQIIWSFETNVDRKKFCCIGSNQYVLCKQIVLCPW
jgi:hypothetical protein